MRNVFKKMVTMVLVTMMVVSMPFTALAEEYSYVYAPTDCWLGTYYSTDGTYDYQMDISQYWNDPNWTIFVAKFPSNDPYAPATATWNGTIWIDSQFTMLDGGTEPVSSGVIHYSGNDTQTADAIFMYCINTTDEWFVDVIGTDIPAFPVVSDASRMKKISDSYPLRFRGDIPSWYWSWSDTYDSAYVNYSLWLITPTDTMPNGAAIDPMVAGLDNLPVG